ncbi:hypothetical protein B296_00045924 [Ensete ventricosum]|uniref:Uncharacterized protein n=1 Tax=Ensete ventricosum TaxID=4639 RepID=A0A426XM18_ENSVE|nr:hypothetical protein B296_00045924 [Ensete ventricosum]
MRDPTNRRRQRGREEESEENGEQRSEKATRKTQWGGARNDIYGCRGRDFGRPIMPKMSTTVAPIPYQASVACLMRE